MLQSKRRSSPSHLNPVRGRAGERVERSVPAQFLRSSPPADGRPSMHETVLQSFGVVGIEVGLLLGARKPVLELDPGTLSILFVPRGANAPGARFGEFVNKVPTLAARFEGRG